MIRDCAARILAIASLSSCALPTGDTARQTQQPIVGGEPADYPSVIPILDGRCGAVLLAPNLLLTAKHCVAPLYGGPFSCTIEGEVRPPDPDDNITYPDAGKFGATMEPDLITVGRNGSSPHAPKVLRVLTTEDPTICGADAALLVLDRDIDDPVLAPLRTKTMLQVGEPLVAVGYGATLEENNASILQKRDVVVMAVGPTEGVTDQTSPVAAGFFTIGEALCRGDSGSPIFDGTGAVVGVASTVSREDLDDVTGTSSDCVSPFARGRYQAIAEIDPFLSNGFDEAGAEPWLAGEPDPRGALAGFEEPCGADSDCKSNVCLPRFDGALACSTGCLSGTCANGYACEVVADRMRCVESAPVPSQPAGQAGEDGCATGGGSPTRWGWVLAAVMLLHARSRRRSSPMQCSRM